MKRVIIPSLMLAGLAPSHATVIAQFDFEPNTIVSENANVDVDGSAQAGWTTTNLTDMATGIGALSASNQNGANRAVSTLGATGNMLNISSNRESDAQTPIAAGGNNESTWFSFVITPDVGVTIDFNSQNATVDTYANHPTGLGGTVKADWTLYYSTNGGTSWTSLGTQTGAGSTGAGQFPGPLALTWDLSALGTQTSAIGFIIDPVSTGSTNGNVTQRGVSLDNLIVNAAVTVPEPAVALLGGLGLLGLLRRRRH